MKNILQNKLFQKILVGVVVVIMLLISSVRIVESGQVGIRVRLGKVSSKTTSEGINLQIPVVEKIEKLNIRVQKTEVTTNSSSKDLQDVDMSLVVNYRIDKDKAVNLYKTVGKNYEIVILEPAIEEEIKAVTSRYTAEELITQRSKVSEEAKKELDKKVSKYGIIINEFNITNFKFSEEFSKAIEEKQVAEQKVLTAKQELEKEKIEAEKLVVAAEAEKKANELKQQSLTDNIIKDNETAEGNTDLREKLGLFISPYGIIHLGSGKLNFSLNVNALDIKDWNSFLSNISLIAGYKVLL